MREEGGGRREEGAVVVQRAACSVGAGSGEREFPVRGERVTCST